MPSSGDFEACWSQPIECLWHAPPTFTTSRPLKSRYETLLTHQQDARRVTERLFRDVLEVSDCSWRNIMHELEYASQHGYDYPEAIPELYDRLHLMAGLTRKDGEEIR